MEENRFRQEIFQGDFSPQNAFYIGLKKVNTQEDVPLETSQLSILHECFYDLAHCET